MSILNAKNKFSKDTTMLCKGVFILFLLIHHVFAKEFVDIYNISLPFKNLFPDIIIYFKICIAGFAFLTAYGITNNFMKNEVNNNMYISICTKRIIKLEFSIVIIYIMAILYKRFYLIQSIKEIYIKDGLFNILYLVIDSLGFASYFGTGQINVTWWYLSYAIVLIFCMPFIFHMVEKYSEIFCLVSLILPSVIWNDNVLFTSLFSSAVMGSYFAYNNIFVSLVKLGGGNGKLKF